MSFINTTTNIKNHYDLLIKDFKLDESKVLIAFPYGSRVYGTDRPESDYDYIVVMDDSVHDQDSLSSSYHNFNATIYGLTSFTEKLNLHKISALECWFLPAVKLLKFTHVDIKFALDKKILRESISEKASHSWVKAKKKFEVVQDRNVYAAKKSLFHSLRIIDFGIQIASKGKIEDYSSSNYLWEEIYTNPAEQWEPYKKQYQLFYNNQMTEFRKLAPK